MSLVCQVQRKPGTDGYLWCPLAHQSVRRLPGALSTSGSSQLFSLLPTLNSAHGLSFPSFSFLDNPDISDRNSFGSRSPLLALSSVCSLFSSLPILSPVVAWFHQVAMFTPLLSLPAQDSSRCLWLYSPSHPQSNPYCQPCLGAIVSSLYTCVLIRHAQIYLSSHSFCQTCS